MPPAVLLSAAGSDRATAYTSSCKIARHGQRLYVGWLDAPERPGAPTRAMLAACDGATGEPLRTFPLGQAYDNHCGPALALSREGRLHAVIGAHGQAGRAGAGAFTYRWSDDPADPQSWSEPIALGPADTYPSLVVDGHGTLHLAHREGTRGTGGHWQLWYRRKRPGEPWEPPRPLVESPTPGYCHYGHSLAVGPEGTLHLLFQFHHGPTGRAQDCKAVGIAHLRSPDSGTTWLCDDRPLCEFPTEMDCLALIRHAPGGGLAISNVVVDGAGRPWFLAADPDAPTGLVWHHGVEGWHAAALPPILPAGGFHLGAGSLTRDRAGRLHAAIAAPPDGRPVPFFDPTLEICHLVLDGGGDLVCAFRITEIDPCAAQWLPAMEWWDWGRADETCRDRPWLAYTKGLNAGGIGGDNTNALRTEVHLTHLAAPEGE